MSEERRILDDETVCRRIPPTAPWFEPPDRISSANFKLDTRKAELGLSVYRLGIVSIDQVLVAPDAIQGSRITTASVKAIRELTNADDKPLNLEVIAVDDEEDNPGHAEIRGPEAGKLTAAASKALQRLFSRNLIPTSPT